MRLLIILVIFSTTLNIGYSMGVVDTTDIIYKAKLLTLSRFGLSDSSSALDEVESQNAILLPSPTSNLFFIQIDFNQRGSKGAEWLGECSYFVGFNVFKNTFYRLGGFDKLDVEDFFEDLNPEDYGIYDLEFLEKSVIDFYCLSEYNDLSKRKKRRRKFDCFEVCSEILFQELIIPASAGSSEK